MDTQPDSVDGDEGWDDIYSSQTQEKKREEEIVKSGSAHTADGTLPLIADLERTADKSEVQNMEGVVVEAPLVAETNKPIDGLDAQSQQVLDETTTVDVNTLDAGEMDVSTAPVESGLLEQSTAIDTSDLIAKDFADAAAKQKDDPQAEWQFNSSDEDSSESSDTSSDDSANDSDDEYALLDPATAAKMLMAGDGDDEEGNAKRGKSESEHQPRTANEVKEDIIPRPEIDITPQMKITALGKIEGVIENNILIRGHTSGEYQVLEPGSVLCNVDRKVVGVVADLFGRVQQPMYSVMFNMTQQELLQELQLVTGTELFYVEEHSKFVFTQPLRNNKGTDASNIHDEEVGEDEIEFSDDEKEAEYKRQKKLAKKAGRGGLSRGAFNDGQRVDHRQNGGHNDNTYLRSSDVPSTSYGGGMNYDDDNSNDGFYQPLRRPDNLAELMSAPPGRRDEFMRGRGRGRGDRGRGRGDRGGRGRGGQRSWVGREAGHTTSSTSTPHPHPPAAAAPLQAYAQPPAQYAPPQQTYQFNGYTFQYGAQAQAPQYPQSQYPQYQQAPTAYVNPAYYPQAGYPQQTAAYPSQYPPAQVPPAAVQPQLTAAQQQDLAEVMRRLGTYPPQGQ